MGEVAATGHSRLDYEPFDLQSLSFTEVIILAGDFLQAAKAVAGMGPLPAEGGYPKR